MRSRTLETKKHIQTQTNSKLRIIHLCFLFPSWEMNSSLADPWNMNFSSLLKHAHEGKHCIVSHGLRIKLKGTVIHNKVCRCYSQRIAVAELNLAQQFSDHLQKSLFHLNIAQKQGEMHKAKQSWWTITREMSKGYFLIILLPSCICCACPNPCIHSIHLDSKIF